MKSIHQRHRVKTGKRSEKLAERYLKSLGLLHVEPIETGWVILRSGNRIKSAFPKKKVSGDFIAMEPETARLVHIEVKHRQADRLPWSVFEDHQIEKMNAKTEDGALCLVLWVRGMEIKSLRWPIPGFGPRKSIKWEKIK